MLLSDSLFSGPFDYDVVHVNAEFADQASDHDPQVVRLTGNRPPTVAAGGPYAVDEGGSATPTTTRWTTPGTSTATARSRRPASRRPTPRATARPRARSPSA